MNDRNKIFACDTESTTDTGRVWCVQFAPLGSPNDDVGICENFDEFFEPFRHKKYGTITLYFHNLKWDAQHILHYLLSHDFTYCDDYRPADQTFNTCISEMGQFYSITIGLGENVIRIYDSLKILPFTLAKIGKDFNLTHQKLTMDYNKQSLADCSPEDIAYLNNDVLVLKDALNFMLDKNMTKMTIGSNCLQEFKSKCRSYKSDWCDMVEIKLNDYGSADADEYVRKSYKGGYCYNNAVGATGCGMTLDVNSLYPSMMNSNRLFPVGKPTFFKGNIPNQAKRPDKVYVVRFKARFNLKQGKLPTVQIKGSFYPSNEWLKSSSYYPEPVYWFGEKIEQYPELTMTSVDFELFMTNYDVTDLEILDGCYFSTKTGRQLYGKYIDYWATVKMTSTGAMRQLAKLMLNNLYGKLGTNRNSAVKIPYMENNIVRYHVVKQQDKKTIYIPQATFITSYARLFTITAGEKNLDRLVYCDTDSLHLVGSQDPIGVEIHPTAFEHWAVESIWDKGIFLRQKTYAEHIVSDKGNKWDIKACGLPKRAKDLFLAKCKLAEPPENLDQQESDWLYDGAVTNITDFKAGFEIPVGKLQAKNTEYGVVLRAVPFKIKERKALGQQTQNPTLKRKQASYSNRVTNSNDHAPCQGLV